MKPVSILLFCAFFVISGCKTPEKPAEAKKYLVKNIISQAADDSLCPLVTPTLLKAIAKQETRTDHNKARFEKHYFKKVSGTWDELLKQFEDSVSHGETQIMGKTARAKNIEPSEIRTNRATAYSLTANILGHDICETFDGDLAKGVAAYNAGPDWQKKGPKVRAKALKYVEEVKNIIGLKEWNRMIGLRKNDSRTNLKLTLAKL